MSKERKCESYVIFDSARAGEVEVVIGRSLTAVQPYATWKTYAHTDFQSYQHGHYFSSEQEARIDYYGRLMEAWEHYFPAKEKAKNRAPEQKASKRGKTR